MGGVDLWRRENEGVEGVQEIWRGALEVVLLVVVAYTGQLISLRNCFFIQSWVNPCWLFGVVSLFARRRYYELELVAMGRWRTVGESVNKVHFIISTTMSLLLALKPVGFAGAVWIWLSASSRSTKEAGELQLPHSDWNESRDIKYIPWALCIVFCYRCMRQWL